MSASTVDGSAVPAGVRWKRIVLPPEHGAWGFLFEPIIVGLVLASTIAGWLTAFSAIAAFLARNPLRIALADRRLGVSSARTRSATMAGVALVAIAFSLFSLAISLGDARMMIPLIIAVPLALAQQRLEAMRKSRALAAEIFGTLSIGSVASIIALGGGATLVGAAALWFLLSARAVPAVLYVRSRIALEKRGVRPSPAPVIAHVLAVAGAAALLATAAGNIPALVVLALLLARCVLGLSRFRRKLTARRIGVMELVWSAVTVAAIIAGAM